MKNPVPEPSHVSPAPDSPATGCGPDTLPANLTLEQLIDLTDEMEHLNELVLLHLEKEGGFTCTEAYFSVVQPVLDLLEAEIRFHYHAALSRDEMKAIICEWIDGEICRLQ